MNKAEFIFSITIALLVTPIAMEVNALAQPEMKTAAMKERAQAWFDSEDIKKRRIQMRQMTRALKQPCKYCHTAGFKGYTNQYSISLEMMVISAEHDVRCDECHSGKKALTPLGVQAAKMTKVSQNLGVECNHCHVQKMQFKALTLQGEAYRLETAAQQSPEDIKAPASLDDSKHRPTSNENKALPALNPTDKTP